MKRLKAPHFVLLGLGLALILAVFISPFASSHPDGLEWIAGEQGFLNKQTYAKRPPPFAPDYSTPGVQAEGVSTAVAGLIGTLVVFALGFGLERLLRSRSTGKHTVGDPPAGKLAP